MRLSILLPSVLSLFAAITSNELRGEECFRSIVCIIPAADLNPPQTDLIGAPILDAQGNPVPDLDTECRKNTLSQAVPAQGALANRHKKAEKCGLFWVLVGGVWTKTESDCGPQQPTERDCPTPTGL